MAYKAGQDKIEKALGRDTVDEMNAMSEGELKKVIVESNGAMKQVKEELEANEKYQQLKNDLSFLTQGKRDVNKRQNARIQYSLTRLEELGKMDVNTRDQWEKDSLAFKRTQEEKKRQSKEDEFKQELKEIQDLGRKLHG